MTCSAERVPKSPLPLRQRARLHSLLVCELRGGQAAVLPSLDDLDPLTSGTGRCPLAFFRHRQALAGVPPTVNDVLGGTGTPLRRGSRIGRTPDASSTSRSRCGPSTRCEHGLVDE